MEWLFIGLILAWYISTGIREGLQWSKTKDFFLGLSKNDWFVVTNTVVCTTAFITIPSASLTIKLIFLLLVYLYIFFSNLVNSKLDLDLKYFTLDYHSLRTLEGLILFVMFLIGGMNFFVLSAWWIIGNYIYKRFMNKVMYDVWHKISDMKVYKILGYDLKYSDWYYELTLIIPLIYFLFLFL